MPKYVQIRATNPPIWRRGCLTALLSVMTVILYCAACVFLIDSRMRIPDEFCTLEDEDYQVFAENAEELAKEFPATYSPGGYTGWASGGVFVEYWVTGEGHLMLFKPTLFAPRFYLGAGGYIYTPTGIVPEFGDPEDEVTHLNGNFYCYMLHDPG